MANAEINLVGGSELGLITDLYNEVYKPRVDITFFENRFQNKTNALSLIAEVGGRPVGFSCGYEFIPNVWFSWLIGVMPDFRRSGIASQLAEAEQSWAFEHGYHTGRLEYISHYHLGLQFALSQEYNIIGLCWDNEYHANTVIFEKDFSEHM